MTRKNETLVGLVIVAGVVVAVLGTLWLQDYHWGQPEQEVEALVRDVGQLVEGNHVKLRGVGIGRVHSITVEPDGQAVRLVLRIREAVSLPPDAGVLLAPESMFGDWQAEITSRARFPGFDWTEPAESGVLPGYTLPDLSRLTAVADEIAANLSNISERVDLAFTEETARNIAATVDNIQDVSEGLGQLIGQQARTFANLADEMERTAEDIGAAARSTRLTFDRMEGVLATGEVEGLITDARLAAENLRQLSGDFSASVSEIRRAVERADSTFERLDRVGARIEAGEGTLGRLLADTALALRAEGAVEQLLLLLEDVRENPGRYVRLSIF